MLIKKTRLRLVLLFMLVYINVVPRSLICSVGIDSKSNIFAYGTGVATACLMALYDRDKIKPEHLPYCLAFPLGGLVMYNCCEYITSDVVLQRCLIMLAALFAGGLIGVANKKLSTRKRDMGTTIGKGAILGGIVTVPTIAVARWLK